MDHALRYAGLGLHVFPLHTPVGAGCSCRKADCTSKTSAGKHPRTKNGLLDATLDEEQIRKWWGMWPEANIAIATGQSGLVVVDIDPRHGGDPDDLATTFGRDIFSTVTAATGGGGWHLVYRCPPGVPVANVNNSPRFTGPLGPGVDIRASGGYIVAPPSLHASGASYEWDVDMSPFDLVPARLPDKLLDVLVGPRTKQEQHEPVDVAAIMEGVPQGERDWQLFRLAAKLRGADVPIEWAYKLVGEAAAACTPPLTQADARAKVDSAYNRYPAGQHAHVSVAPEDMRHAEGLEGRELLWPVIKDGAPPERWVIKPVLVPGRVHLLYGEPESGKTVLGLSWVLLMVEMGLPVLIVDEESGIVALATMLEAMGADERVDELVHYFPFPSIDLESVDALVAYADEVRPAVVIFDSLTDMLTIAGLDENSGPEVTKWMKGVAERLSRAEYEPAVLLIDHITKDALNTKYSIGSRAKKAKADVAWEVRKLAEFDKTKTAKVELHRHKNRPGYLPKSMAYTVGGEDGRLIARPFDVLQDGITSLSPGAHRVLMELGDGPLQNKEIAERTGYSKTAVNNFTRDLITAGRLERVKKNGYDAYAIIEQVGDGIEQVGDASSPTSSPTSAPPLGGSGRSMDEVGERYMTAYEKREREKGTWKD